MAVIILLRLSEMQVQAITLFEVCRVNIEVRAYPRFVVATGADVSVCLSVFRIIGRLVLHQ